MKTTLTSFVLAAAGLVLLWATPVRLRAATINVTNTADSGPGTLRAALADAADGDTIVATGVSGTITLTSGQLTVSNSVTILGPGAGTLTVSGTSASRVFEVTGTNVTISGLTIANGQGALYGAGIRTSGRAGSVVTVSDCVVTNNRTTLLGAGIFNSPSVTLTVSNCTVSGNSASSGNGGGIYNSNATLAVIASTLSGNSAHLVGGGIMNDGQSGSATLTISASTLSSNLAWSGGGIVNWGQSGSATLTINASTFNGNWAGYAGGSIQNSGQYGIAAVEIGDTILNAGASGGNILSGSGTVTSRGYNLSSDDGGGFLTATGDQTNTAPLLGPLQDNGGPTWTHALLTNSPAIDQGKSDAIPALARATDQRGAVRASDFPTVTNAAGGDGSDIGAFEAQYVPPQLTPSTAYTFSTLAGWNRVGSEDGVGDNARFQYPQGVAVDSAGNVYVADSANQTIRKITPAGVVSTLAGYAGVRGTNDGPGSNARFYLPRGVTVDSATNLYVADALNHTIRKITPSGTVSTLAGLPEASGTNDGTGSSARFNTPSTITVDTAGNLYVADLWNHTIRKITSSGTVSTLAGLARSPGTNNGTGSSAQFYEPSGVAVDTAGNVYVADEGNHTIRKITPSGTVSTLAGLPQVSGTNDGTGSNARFKWPRGITMDSATNVYVAEWGNNTIRKITPTGVVSTLAGLAGSFGSANGTGTGARFGYPSGIVVDNAGYLYVADSFNQNIRKITSAGVVNTLAGPVGSDGSVDGTGVNARFFRPAGIALGLGGNIYVTDHTNHAIRQISPAGVVSTLAGLAGFSGTNDSAGSNARFNAPLGVAVDRTGVIYVADYLNHTIRKITLPGVVSTLAGLAGTSGTNDGAGSSARFNGPWGIAVDINGVIYVADSGSETVRQITPAGVVSTLAGKAGVGGTTDGVGSYARFHSPQGVAVDSAGALYVADFWNCTIRKITPVGTNWMVSTLAGLAGSYGANDGTGSSARFWQPRGLAVDSTGNVYVTDYANQTIRKITPSGVVSTLAGLAGSQGSADGSGSAALFANPYGIAVDAEGTLYVTDTWNNTIRKGMFTQYTATNAVAYNQPPMDGQLLVTLLPPEANGQWRFPWEIAWRDSRQVASNLVAGNYPVEFRNVPGYLAYPPTVTASVTSGGTTELTNQYYPTFNLLGTTNSGSLTVSIGPAAPSGAGWRFLGETAWRTPGSTADNLLPDTYAIEFKPVSGYSKPASQAVQVSAGTTASVWASYLLAQAPPAGVQLPASVPPDSIGDLENYPYGFNGQLQSDTGYGSGVAVEPNVVLTAAHLVFNDQTLSYVSQVYWRFRQETGVFSPQPQAARGWYILGGYAVQRTNDMLGGLGPDRSSPQSRNLDVAALYFPSPVAGGGYGGCLPSDTVPNTWLTSTSQKLLVGYPVDGSSLGDASIVPGLMYQAGPQPYPLSLATDPVANQQVYLGQWFLSYPGNSGGPLYVQYNGYYYPAGVYLGTLYNGVVPYASLVRGIDSNVVNLITSAQALGDSGTNSTGGGVITIRAGSGSGMLAYLQVNIGPQAALGAGAAWRLQGTTAWSGGSTYTATIAAGDSVTLEFKPVAGWNVPVNNTVQITLGQLTVVPATYTPNPARLAVSPAGGLTANGFAGGPFSPSSVTYTLTNSGGASLNWSVSKTADWLSLSTSSGTLTAGANTNVTVNMNANASSLAPGNYSGAITFTNLTTGLGNTSRSVSLSVETHPVVRLANPQLLTDGNLAMTLQGITNGVYSILGSTSLLQPLTNWTEVLRLTNTAGHTRFTNPPTPASPQFYRAREL